MVGGTRTGEGCLRGSGIDGSGLSSRCSLIGLRGLAGLLFGDRAGMGGAAATDFAIVFDGALVVFAVSCCAMSSPIVIPRSFMGTRFILRRMRDFRSSHCNA